jgi:hypothetical protein
MYIEDQPRKFTNDKKKITFVLSFMAKGVAGQWADNWLTKKYDQRDMEIPEPDFEDLLNDLDEAFKNNHEQKEAQQALETLKQGSLSAEEFFQSFENLRFLAGYQHDHDGYLINLLERNFDRYTVKNISIQADPPTKYQDWKRVATRVHNLKRRFDGIPSTEAPKPQWKPKGGNFRNYGSTSSAVATPKAVTFGGSGQPMEVDQAKGKKSCYRCGRDGHIIKECPIKREGLICHQCGKEGHMKKACRGGKGKEVNREVEVEQTRTDAIHAIWEGMDAGEQSNWLQGLLVAQKEEGEHLKE